MRLVLWPSVAYYSLLCRVKVEEASVGCRKILSGLHVLIISTDKLFTDDWQSVLDSLGAAVTKRTAASARLAQIRAPDVVVTDNKAPTQLCTVWSYSSSLFFTSDSSSYFRTCRQETIFPWCQQTG